MRATLTTICIVLGICIFVAGCNDTTAKLPTWGSQDQVAAENEYDYEYDYDDEEYYGCEQDYYADSEYYDGEYYDDESYDYYDDESYDDEYYSEYDQSGYVAYEPCEHGYWYPHEECDYSD